MNEEAVWFEAYNARLSALTYSTPESADVFARASADLAVKAHKERWEPVLRKEEPKPIKWKHGDRVEAKRGDHVHKGTIVEYDGCLGIVLDEVCRRCVGSNPEWVFNSDNGKALHKAAKELGVTVVDDGSNADYALVGFKLQPIIEPKTVLLKDVPLGSVITVFLDNNGYVSYKRTDKTSTCILLARSSHTNMASLGWTANAQISSSAVSYKGNTATIGGGLRSNSRRTSFGIKTLMTASSASSKTEASSQPTQK